jgi:hypothetical protein
MLPEERTYRPELLPRQGEINAWLFALLASLALGLLHQQGVVPVFSWIFVIFLLVSALSISLGNWMDRRTILRIAADCVSFENGLRRVSLTWPQINEVRIRPARWGEQIQVIGEQSHFSFNTLGELQFKGENRAKVGFVQGQEILKEILNASGLTRKKQNDQYAYYSRA